MWALFEGGKLQRATCCVDWLAHAETKSHFPLFWYLKLMLGNTQNI